MDIVLDTNILRADLLLRSKDFNAIQDYLERTDSLIYLPKIVIEEIQEIHSKTLNDRISKANNEINHINLAIVDNKTKLPQIKVNLEEENNKYIDFVKEKLKIRETSILDAKDSFLSEITNRAIKRIKPCGQDGQGFRDAIIWLTIKNFCATRLEKQIAFISNNDKDFSNSDKTA